MEEFPDEKNLRFNLNHQVVSSSLITGSNVYKAFVSQLKKSKRCTVAKNVAATRTFSFLSF
jgi:hypothetical protein